MYKKRKLNKRAISKARGFRSGLEMDISENLIKRNVKFEYETLKIKYEIPARRATYTPDFILHNGVIVESKGRFTASDRKKMLLVKEHNPELDIRMLFCNSNTRIAKNSKTTYADWCIKHGFKFADKIIPDSWLH